MRSKRCTVQNQGITLKTMECFFFSAYCDIMMVATYRKLLVYLLLKPLITVNETTKNLIKTDFKGK